VRGDPWSEREAMRQLEELGYVEPPGEDQRAAVERYSREARFYLARALMSQGRLTEALPDLELLCREVAEQRYGLRLAACYRELGRVAEMRNVVEALTAEHERRRAEEAAAASDGRQAEVAQPRPTAGLELLWGQLLLAEGREAEALERLHRAERADPRHPMLHLSIGRAYLRRRRWADAERAFARAVAIDPDSAAAHHGLGVAHLRRRRWRLAAASALQAVALRYAFPAAHFHLGEALARLGRYRRAAEAFEVCLAQAPRVRDAHLWLARLYRLRLGDPERAAAHLAAAGGSASAAESEP